MHNIAAVAVMISSLSSSAIIPPSITWLAYVSEIIIYMAPAATRLLVRYYSYSVQQVAVLCSNTTSTVSTLQYR